MEFLEEADRSHRRVPRLDRQACAFLIGRHLLLLAVADLEQSEGNLGQCAYILKMPLARISLELHAFGAVVLVHVFDLVAKHRGELVFGVHEVKQAASQEMVQALKQQGMSVDKYQEMLINVQTNPALAGKVDHYLKESAKQKSPDQKGPDQTTPDEMSPDDESSDQKAPIKKGSKKAEQV